MKPSKALLNIEECAEKCREYKVFIHQIPYLTAYKLQYDFCMEKCVETQTTEEKEHYKRLRHQVR